MPYRNYQLLVPVLMYLGTAFLLWFYSGSHGASPANSTGFIFLGSFWSLLTVGSFSAIEARSASPSSLVIFGVFQILIGCVAAALAVPFAKPEAFGSFLYSALLYPSAAAGANFATQGASELLRGQVASQVGATLRGTSQQFVIAGYVVLFAGLCMSGLCMQFIKDPFWQKLGEQMPLFVGAAIGLNWVTQGVVERARSHQISQI